MKHSLPPNVRRFTLAFYEISSSYPSHPYQKVRQVNNFSIFDNLLIEKRSTPKLGNYYHKTQQHFQVISYKNPAAAFFKHQENESEMATFYESTFRSEMYTVESRVERLKFWKCRCKKHRAQPNGPLAAADTYALRGQKRVRCPVYNGMQR